MQYKFWITQYTMRKCEGLQTSRLGLLSIQTNALSYIGLITYFPFSNQIPNIFISSF